MINNFQVGSVVTGKSFIGRKELIKQYRKQILNKSRSSSLSIRGLTRTGKTSFIINVFNKIPEDILYCYVDMKEPTSYYELWVCILDIVHDYLKNRKLIDEEVRDWFEVLGDEKTPWIKFVRTIKKLFSYISDNKIKTIIVLDEFDNASTIFENQTSKWELFRSLVSGADFFITAILISRRNLHEIEGQTFQSSTFKGVFDTRYFTGFNADDLEEYYDVFQKKSVILSEKQKSEIQYYAGNSPYLLSIMGNRIIDRAKNGKELDIADIFKNDCKAINDYYADILTHLTRDGRRNKLISFVLGPNIGITSSDKDELLNLGYLRKDSNKYISISKYFEDYLRNLKLNEPIWEKITTTEKKIKIIIEKERNKLKAVNGINISDKKKLEKEIMLLSNEITDVDIKRYDTFIASNKRDWNVMSTYFDVMSLTDSFNIIMSNWTVFCKYFNNEMLSSWKPKFKLIGVARNPPAHVHEEYLTEEVKRDVDNYCSDIQKYIAKVYEPDTEANHSELSTFSQNFESVTHGTQSIESVNDDNKESIKTTKYNEPHTKKTTKRLQGVILEKNINSNSLLFVKVDGKEDEYFIYREDSPTYNKLKSGNIIEFELKEFSAPGKPPKLFAVNYKILQASEEDETASKLSGRIIEEKQDKNGNKYLLIERKNEKFPLKAFSNKNPIEYYNHKVGDIVSYEIKTNKASNGIIYESAIILPDN